MTPEERAAAIVEAQGEDLSRYQRMFLASDIATAIKEAVSEATSPLVAALRAVLNSDMAMREEDEGQTSDTLALVRAALKEVQG